MQFPKQALLAMFFLFGGSGFAQQDSILYSFFVAGHSSGASGVNNPGLHPPFKAHFQQLQNHPHLALGILAGDFVSPQPTPQDFDEVDADLSALPFPVYLAPGNHDMENRNEFEQRYGSTFFSFTHQNDLFIILDPNYESWNISEEQLSFIAEVLTLHQHNVEHVFVIFHQLIWTTPYNVFRIVTPNSWVGRAETLNFWTEVQPLFNQVQTPITWIAGDLGSTPWSDDIMFYQTQNQTFIATGMGEGPGDNYVILNVWSSGAVTYDLIPLEHGDPLLFSTLEEHYIETAKTSLLLYPNPSAGKVHLQLSNLEKFSEIRITNIAGQELISVKEGAFHMDFTGWKSGIYWISVRQGDLWFTSKLILDQP